MKKRIDKTWIRTWTGRQCRNRATTILLNLSACATSSAALNRVDFTHSIMRSRMQNTVKKPATSGKSDKSCDDVVSQFSPVLTHALRTARRKARQSLPSGRQNRIPDCAHNSHEVKLQAATMQMTSITALTPLTTHDVYRIQHPLAARLANSPNNWYAESSNTSGAHNKMACSACMCIRSDSLLDVQALSHRASSQISQLVTTCRQRP